MANITDEAAVALQDETSVSAILDEAVPTPPAPAVTGTSFQVLIDFINPAFSPSSAAGSSFTDITASVRLDTGISLARGRQDAVADVQSGSATFTVDNTDGSFTANNSSSPFYPNVKLGRRVQINVKDEAGTYHTRFDGSIIEIDYSFDPTGTTATAAITCADVLASLGRNSDLNCWTKELVLSNKPTYHWTLDDDSTSTIASESSGNNGPLLRLRHMLYSTGKCTFQGGTGGVETMANAPDSSTLGTSPAPLASPYFTTALGSGTYFDLADSSSAQLSGEFPALSTRTGSNFAVEFWTMLDPGAFTSIYNSITFSAFVTALSLADTRTGKNFMLHINPGAGGVNNWEADTYASPLSSYPPGTTQSPLAVKLISAPFPAGGVPIHWVLNVTGASTGGTMTIYMNGVSQGTLALPAGWAPDWIDVGGAYGGGAGWQGNISLVSIYPTTLTTGQISADAGMGTDAMYNQNSSACIQQVATFAGLPSFWSNLPGSGLAVTDYVDISGLSPASAMQQFEQTEVAGLLYVDATGKLNFAGRHIRMGASSPDLTLPPGSYSADLGYKITDQYLITRSAIGTAVTTKAASIINSAADTDYGQYPAGTPRSPDTIPVLSQNPEFTLRGLPSGATQLDPYVTDPASWRAFRSGVPPFKATSVTVDMLTMNDPTSPTYIAPSALYAAEINKIVSLGGTVDAFPDDFGSLDMFVEGVDEHIDLLSHTLTFYTSPANLFRCWKPGDATWGALDSSAVIGIGSNLSSANAPRAKLHVTDPGPPFYPPTYASTMNNGGVTGRGFVGATDQRGVFDTLQKLQTPPLCVVGQASTAQSFASGTSAAEKTIVWDTLYMDSAGGWGIVPGSPNFYAVQLPGFYELDCVIEWAAQSAGNRYARFIVNPSGVTQGPTGASAISVAGTERTPPTGKAAAVTLSTRLYCGVGTTIGVRCWQDSGVTLSTGLSLANGSLFSIRFTGYATSAD